MSKTELRQIAAAVPPTGFDSALDYLAAVYQEAKAKIPAYSYIKFTEDLGFGHCNAMFLIIHKQRPLTLKSAQKIVLALELRGIARKYFLQLVTTQRLADPTVRENAFERLVELKSSALPKALDKKQLDFYNHWYNAAILELLSLPDASDDLNWLATHLMPTVPPGKIEASLKLLKALGHIAYSDEKKRFVPTQAEVSTGSEVIGLAVTRYHQQMIALGKDALTDIAPLERDISAVTIAVDAQKMDELKTKIRNFRRELLEWSKATEHADEIAQVNIQLFPIARLAVRSKRNESR